MDTDAVVGADRRLRIRHADVDVLATDWCPQDPLQRVLDQRVPRRLVHVPFTRQSVGMNPDAHDPNARINQLATDLPQCRNCLANVRRDLGSRLDHRLEELAIDVALLRIRFSNDSGAVISQLVVGPDQQQFLFNSERERRLDAEAALPEVGWRRFEAHGVSRLTDFINGGETSGCIRALITYLAFVGRLSVSLSGTPSPSSL